MPSPESLPESLPESSPDMDAPRVMHLRSSCGFYGAEGVIYNLARHYAGEALTVCLADAREPHTELCDRLASAGLPAETLSSRGAFDPGLLGRLASVLRRVRPDVVHAHEYKSDVLAYLVTRGLRLARPVPLVATMHGVVRTTGALRRYERWDARVLRRFNAVVAVSAGSAASARDYGVPDVRLHTIPNGIDTGLFQPEPNRSDARMALGVPPDGTLIGMVGRLSEEKGPGILLEAFAAIDRKRGARLAFIGDGPLEGKLRARAAELGLSHSVHFPGRRDDMPRVYGAIDILALPSLTEGLPLTILEASACGVPVVASDVGDVGKALPHGVAGLLVRPGDVAGLAAALSDLVSQPERGRALAGAARDRVLASYSAGAMAGAYEDVYRRVAGRARDARPMTVEAAR